MTRRLGKGDAERGRARLALVTVVLLTVSLLLGVSPGGSLTSVLAAVSGSPTSTSTDAGSNTGAPATPTASAGTPIQLLNPSKYSDDIVVSDKDDADSDYHLVAWVANLTNVTDPVVEFEVRTTGTTPSTVFSAPGLLVGTTDTYQAKWPVAEADGDYTVHVTLFSGTTQLSTDSEAVTVRKSAETAEMSYPTVAGTLGVYDPPGATALPGFVVDVTTSANPRDIDILYGTSPPGTEQNWRECTQQVTVFYSGGKDKRIGCTVRSGVTATSITGVAALTGGTVEFDPGPLPNCMPQDIVDPGPPPLCPSVDSGDAHRVFGYEQSPTSYSISAAGSSPVINNCHDLTVTVVDTLARPVWRAPVDLHGIGPADNLQFGDTARTSNWQPPDQGGHDSTEPTSNCGGSGTPPAQAEHNRPGTAPDEKHIESLPATASGEGTDTSGGFNFALRSGSGGTTVVEAWFDADEDDTRDSGEPSTVFTFDWLASSPSGSRSASATGSATTTSPTATRSASSTQSSPSARTISIEASRNTVRFGKKVMLGGIVDSANTSCEGGQTVRIHRAPVGSDFQEIGSVVTGSDGSYAFETTPAETATYRATVDGSSSCQAATSSDEVVRVRVKVTLSVSDRRVSKGDKVRLTATVAPCADHNTTEVALMRSFGKRFKEIARKDLDAHCKASFKNKVKRDSAFKAKWPSQDNDHEGNSSKERVVQVKGR